MSETDPGLLEDLERLVGEDDRGDPESPLRWTAKSKWNKIEHRLFSFISQNWRGKPLISHEVIINLIAATSTRTGLKVYAQLDERPYPKKQIVTDKQLAAVNLTGHQFHPEWNYTISPTPTDTTETPR